jgi:hypothetical protein
VCTICHRPLPAETGRYACAACEHHLDYVLRQLVAELPLLRDQLAPHRSPVVGTRAGAAVHPPLPVDVRVLDLLATQWVPDTDGQDSGGIPLGPLLVGWCCHLARHYPAVTRHPAGTWYITRGTEPVPRAAGGIPGWASWLRGYLPFAATWPWVEQLHNDLDDALRRVRAITDTKPRTVRKVAPCPACQAFALARTDGQFEVVCGVCGHRMDPDQYTQHASEVLPPLTALAVRIAAAETGELAS